jgi:hypothetical protein
MRWLREGLMLVVCILVVVAFLLSASWAVAHAATSFIESVKPDETQ